MYLILGAFIELYHVFIRETLQYTNFEQKQKSTTTQYGGISLRCHRVTVYRNIKI